MDFYYVLHLTHPTHSNYYVHTSRESAKFAVNEYVSDMWNELMEGDIPATSDEAIEAFYNTVEDEHWTIAPSAMLTLV
jgi:hypothetical protein